MEDIALELFGETICKQLSSANWKERLEAVEEITKVETHKLGPIYSRSDANGSAHKLQRIALAFTRDPMEPNLFGIAFRT